MAKVTKIIDILRDRSVDAYEDVISTIPTTDEGRLALAAYILKCEALRGSSVTALNANDSDQRKRALDAARNALDAFIEAFNADSP